jgi:hypothetical protein
MTEALDAVVTMPDYIKVNHGSPAADSRRADQPRIITAPCCSWLLLIRLAQQAPICVWSVPRPLFPKTLWQLQSEFAT